MKNAYKRLDIFKCVHEAHKGFESRMSAHHILNKKQCFPGGCFHFKWRCKLFSQGKKCYRGYNYMGKNCSGCRYFNEEKVHNHPELQVSEADYAQFQEELKEFEYWLEDHLDKEVPVYGTVDGVKPLFHKRIYGKGESFAFSGFLLIFKELYFDRTLMEDHVYARLSPKTYQSLRFGHGDTVEARATVTLDNGRLVLRRLRRIEIERRGEPAIWNESRALVARETAQRMQGQPEGCLQCPYGALVDVEDQRRAETRKYRQLYCLKGIENYRLCPIYSRYAGDAEARQKNPSNAASCMNLTVQVNRL